MVKAMANKKHLVASFHNLSPELQEEIKQKYPLGFTDAMIRVDKPNGDFFYAVHTISKTGFFVPSCTPKSSLLCSFMAELSKASYPPVILKLLGVS